MEKTKEILERGYVTHALTNSEGYIYGMKKGEYINFELDKIERAKTFYWSEVYCEANYMATIIRKGTRLVNPTAEDLTNYFAQSKVNLH